ncbi:MAG TPA: hypothetical protein VFE32_02165 [Puia sp.]|jgi:uncharacterized protein YecT (DUF1311 family)|nr:hypothetical protein [Puia sp.]
MFTIQCRSHCLLLAALIFIGTRGAAQSAADQSFKTIPQQIKTSAEIKATNKANSVANGATDKVDSGVNKAYRGLMKMFKKKPKPGTGPKDSTGRPVDSLSGAPKVSWIPGRKEGWAVGDGVEDLVACILKTA